MDLAEDDLGGCKLWLARRLLALRREMPDTYESDDYIPLEAAGPVRDQVVGLRRRDLAVVVPRLVRQMARDGSTPPSSWARADGRTT